MVVLLVPLLGCLLVVAQSSGSTEARPRALLKMEAYRAALRTGIVECSTRSTKNPDTLYATGRLAGPDVIWTRRGNADGMHGYDEDGTPMGRFREPIKNLMTGDRMWVRQKDSGMVWTLTSPGFVRNVRTLGLGPGLMSALSLSDTMSKDRSPQLKPHSYSEEVSADGLHVVTAESATGVIKLWIDPKRGWSPVRAEQYVDGELLGRSHITLAQYDGVWFPETVTVYVRGYKDGKEPYESVRVLSAEFNRPEHPQRFTPEDIGFEPNTMMVQEKGDRFQTVATGIYDGETFVASVKYVMEDGKRIPYFRHGDKWITREENRELMAQRSGRRAAARAKPDQRTAIERVPETEWEAYTRRFIAKYSLSEPQAEKALSVLKNCQERARRYLSGKRSAIEALEKRARDLRRPDSKSSTADLAKVADKLAKLRKPLDDIFEKQLKPRLDKLPTRAQRKAATGSKDAPARKKTNQP